MALDNGGMKNFFWSDAFSRCRDDRDGRGGRSLMTVPGRIGPVEVYVAAELARAVDRIG